MTAYVNIFVLTALCDPSIIFFGKIQILELSGFLKDVNRKSQYEYPDGRIE
jgi:hypothetical protein